MTNTVKQMAKKDLDAALRAWERQYDEVNADMAGVRSRAVGFLAGTGVVAGLVALASPVLSGLLSGAARGSATMAWLFPIFVGAAVVLIYFAVGATVLSIRAQSVGVWTVPAVAAGDGGTLAAYAAALHIAARENTDRLANYSGYLRQAQRYYLLVVGSLGVIVAISILLPVFTFSANVAGPRSTTSPAIPRAHAASPGAPSHARTPYRAED